MLQQNYTKPRSNHASSVATADELGKTDNEILTLKIAAKTHITKRIAGVECARQVRSPSLLVHAQSLSKHANEHKRTALV